MGCLRRATAASFNPSQGWIPPSEAEIPPWGRAREGLSVEKARVFLRPAHQTQSPHYYLPKLDWAKMPKCWVFSANFNSKFKVPAELRRILNQLKSSSFQFNTEND
jgi:hypothetical protein